MKEKNITHVFDYKTLTLDDLETLSMYHNYICDGDKKKIIVVVKRLEEK